jgi:tetratricopeptide (TPR) repeat protein
MLEAIQKTERSLQAQLARARAELAEEFAAKIDSEPAHGFAWRARALCAIGTESPDEPLSLLAKSREAWERLGWKYDLGVTWFDTGGAHTAVGDRASALNAYREAFARFGDIGAQPDMDRASRRIAETAP